MNCACLFSLSRLEHAVHSRRDAPRRMTLGFFLKLLATMMRSYFVQGKKQKFGSTLSTVIDVRMHSTFIIHSRLALSSICGTRRGRAL